MNPTAAELGPDAEKFMHRVTVQRRLPIYFAVLSTVTVVAGLILFWIDSSGLRTTWLLSGFGIALTIGGVAALIAFLAGNFAVRPNVERLTAIGAEIRASGGPPSEAQLEELGAVQRRLRTIGLVNLILLIVAVIGMASARYV